MKEQQIAPSKKFLYDDHKKSKQDQVERQFHSKGYHPSQRRSLIDLESVWSVRDVVLDNPAKQHNDMDTQLKANATYYSRHGEYKSNTGKLPIGGVGQPSSQWSSRTEATKQQKFYASGNNTDPLDF